MVRRTKSELALPNKASFCRYLGDRLRVAGAIVIPPLPDLVRQAALATSLPGNPPRLRSSFTSDKTVTCCQIIKHSLVVVGE